MADKRFYVISYDIVDNKTRNKVADILSNHGSRIQKSVFECCLHRSLLDDLMSKLLKVIDKKMDSIRIYYLCEACSQKKAFLGIEVDSHLEEDYRII